MRRGVVHILSRMKQSSWQVLRVLVYMVSCIAKQENIVVAILCRLWHSFVIEGHGSNGVGIQPSSSVE
jgi:hypothetical protein